MIHSLLKKYIPKNNKSNLPNISQKPHEATSYASNSGSSSSTSTTSASSSLSTPSRNNEQEASQPQNHTPRKQNVYHCCFALQFCECKHFNYI